MTEADFLRVADLLPEALLLVATDGTIRAANRAFAADWPALVNEPLEGCPLSALTAEPPEAVADYLRLCARSRQRIPGMLTLSESPCRCEGGLVRSADATTPGLVLLRVQPRDAAVRTFLTLNERIERLNREIGRRRDAEQALAEANRHLQQRSREIEQFVYLVSHDLKSPLVTVLGFAGLLKEAVTAGDAATALDAAGRIERAGQRMNLLIGDLLELSRIGRVRNQPEEIDVAALIRDLADQLAPRFAECQASLAIRDPLPRLVADPARVAQVFDNLLTNALKYGCRSPDPQITVGAAVTADELRYFVRDNGPGIAPEFHQKIFGLFQRLDSTSDGTGLGLALVEKAMHSFGGRAWVESTPDHGATFWLAWPHSYLAPAAECPPAV